MRSTHRNFLVQVAVVTSVANAVDIVYITDLPAFSLLAPCANEAVANAVDSLTNNICPGAVTALESCACTKDQNPVQILSTISKQVLNNCASTATDDVSSASVVFSVYCNQAGNLTPFTPITNGVTQYISDLPAYSDLGPCAGGALNYVLEGMTASKCPHDASALVSCACLKNQKSLLVSESINSWVFMSCSSTHTQDVSSAQAVFAGYCGLNNGTSNFPTMSQLSGKLTYYIKDMTEYSSLAPCAISALYAQAFYTLTWNDCPPAPGALASCACMKDGNSGSINSAVTNAVKNNCGSTASEDITSALAVFDFYCSAAKGLATARGITASVSTTPYATSGGSTAKTAGTSYILPTQTGPDGGGSISTGDSGNANKSSNSVIVAGTHVPLAAIIGGAIGLGLLIILILLVSWIYRRRHHRLNVQPEAGGASDIPPPPLYNGKAELASTSVTHFSQKGPITRKPISSPAVSPITQEMAGAPYRAEAPGTRDATELSPDNEPAATELQGNRPVVTELQGGGNSGAHEAHGNPRHEMDGMGANMNSGLYEMPGQHGWP